MMYGLRKVKNIHNKKYKGEFIFYRSVMVSMQNKTDRNWQNVESILESHFHELRSQLETVGFSKGHSYWVNLRQELIGLQKDMNLNLSIHL